MQLFSRLNSNHTPQTIKSKDRTDEQPGGIAKSFDKLKRRFSLKRRDGKKETTKDSGCTWNIEDDTFFKRPAEESESSVFCKGSYPADCKSNPCKMINVNPYKDKVHDSQTLPDASSRRSTYSISKSSSSNNSGHSGSSCEESGQAEKSESRRTTMTSNQFREGTQQSCGGSKETCQIGSKKGDVVHMDVDTSEENEDEAEKAEEKVVVQTTPSLSTGITPARAISYFGNRLTNHEMGEILAFEQVYYMGESVASKRRADPQAPNLGFDDDRADYRTSVKDHIAYRFEVQGLLGKGSFGRVLQGLDHKTRRQPVAIKVIKNKKVFHQQAQIEHMILKRIRDNDEEHTSNCIHFIDKLVFRNHIIFTFPLLGSNLHEWTKKHFKNGCNLALIWTVAGQVLEALAFLCRQRIVHCDLKPENILLVDEQRSPAVRLIDFGSACLEGQQTQTYIQSRFYRAPEVILRQPYAMAIDMWSMGCLLAEMWTGDPLFCGDSEREQMALFTELRGPCPLSLAGSSRKYSHYFYQDGQPYFPSAWRRAGRAPGPLLLSDVIDCGCSAFTGFIEACLSWDPEERLTPSAALRHTWLEQGYEIYLNK